jgi:hypothetical protein
MKTLVVKEEFIKRLSEILGRNGYSSPDGLSWIRNSSSTETTISFTEKGIRRTIREYPGREGWWEDSFSYTEEHFARLSRGLKWQ